MRTETLVLLAALAAAFPVRAAPEAATVDDAWRIEVEAGVRAIAADSGGAPVSATVLQFALEAAVGEIGAYGPEEAAPLVFAAAVRAELRVRFGEALPRVRAQLRQEFRIAAQAGAAASAQLRMLERVRRRLERTPPGRGGAPPTWWTGPGASRGRWGG